MNWGKSRRRDLDICARLCRRRNAQSGGSFTNLAELSGVVPLYLITDDAYLYYAGAGSIGKVPKDGGAAISVVSVYVAVGGLAVDATSLYFSDRIINHIWKITPK